MPDNITFLTSEEFVSAYNEGKGANIGVRKYYNSEITKAPNDNSRTIEFKISTETPDRDGDVIRANGWRVANFMKNPVVLFAHNSSRPPIGRALDVWIEGKTLKAKAEFMDNSVDTSGFSDMIYRMVKGGFLNATSVGFIPMRWDPITEKMDDGIEVITGFEFKEQELLEFSVVPIPANPQALVSAKSAGINIAPLKGYFEELLDTWAEHNDMLLVPRHVAEEFYEIVKAEKEGKPKHARKRTTRKSAITWASAHPNGTPKAPEDAPWDAGKELREADVEDLLVMCAWRESKPRAELRKGDFKLPHHRASNKAVVWRGVVAAMGALMGARGGVNIPDSDRRGVYNHLARHYRDDFDKEPPEFSYVEQQILEKEGWEMDLEKGHPVMTEPEDEIRVEDEAIKKAAEDAEIVEGVKEEQEAVEKQAPETEEQAAETVEKAEEAKKAVEKDASDKVEEKHEEITEVVPFTISASAKGIDLEVRCGSLDDALAIVDKLLSQAGSVEISKEEETATSDAEDAKSHNNKDADAVTKEPENLHEPDGEVEINDELLKDLRTLVRDAVAAKLNELRGRVN